jgi:sporulation protein YlmC with PRC-barrel domain
MKRQEIHLELLLGKRVFSLNGQPLGRLEEVRAELNNRGSYYVTDFLVGSYAVLERLAAWKMGRSLLRLFRARRSEGHRIRWDQIDLSDPRRPKLKVEVDELMPFT